MLPVRSELDIHRSPQLSAEHLEERRHLGDERGIGDQTLERDHRLFLAEVDVQPRGTPDSVMIHHGDHASHHGKVVAVLTQEILHQHGLESSCLQVDQVDLFGGVPDDLVNGRVYPEARLARSDEDRVVIAQPIHGPGPQSWNQPHQPILPLNARRPPEFVRADRNS